MIAIAGKGKIAVNALNYLNGLKEAELLDREIIAIPSLGDTEHDSWFPSFQQHARNNSIPIHRVDELQDAQNLLLISLEYDQIIKTSRFMSNELFNIHFSLLPRYRGVYTSLWPILNGEEYSGVTLHRITPGIDDGPIISQRKFRLPPYVTCRSLYETYLSEGFELFKESIHGILTGSFSESEQVDSDATYYDKKSVDFAKKQIPLTDAAVNIQRMVKAFFFPEYQTAYLGQTPIHECIILPSISDRKSKILKETNDFFLCSASDGKIVLLLKWNADKII